LPPSFWILLPCPAKLFWCITFRQGKTTFYTWYLQQFVHKPVGGISQIVESWGLVYFLYSTLYFGSKNSDSEPWKIYLYLANLLTWRLVSKFQPWI
jgi:hypothetical protein